MRLLSFRWPKQPKSGSPSTGAASRAGTGQAGCGIRAIGPSKPDARTRSSTWREWTISPVAWSSTSETSGKSSGRVSQSGGSRLSRTAYASSLPDQPGLALHRRQVAGRVAARERQTDDEVVEDELVEDDDPRPPAQRLDDPAVRLGVVADVVEPDVRLRLAAEPAGAGDRDLDALGERRQQQRGVVGDPGAGRRQRAVVGDLHVARRSAESDRAAA